MRIGLVLPPTGDPADVPDTARRAEEQGFDLVASGEHVLFGSPTPNAFVTLAAAAAVTTRVRLLSAVTLLPLYPAPLAAKMAATLDRISGGRFELGIGVGGENPVEFAACGVPVRERGRRTDEALDVLVTLFAGEPHRRRRHARHRSTRCRSSARVRRCGSAGAPRPRCAVPGAPGDVWMPYLAARTASPGAWPRPARRPSATAATPPRSPAPTSRGRPSTPTPPSPGAARGTVLPATYGQDMDRILDAVVPHGTPEQVAARLAEYAEAGADTVVLAPAVDDADRERMLDLVAGEVLPRLRHA